MSGPGAARRTDVGEPLLSVADLRVCFTRRGQPPVVAVDGVSVAVAAGSTVALVGESGSGKSVTALALLGLLPQRGVEVTGRLRFAGRDLLTLSDAQRRQLRGAELAMVFQDPMTSLNPVVPVGPQVAEVLRRHRSLTRSAAREQAVDMLNRVGIPEPRQRARSYPFQLSGGMRQRALIAMALACRPRLLIADEPTTALDVTIQAQILELLRALVADTGTALVMITHDLGIVAGLCDEVHVMYAGRVVESAGRQELFARPAHPYTAGLLGSVPRLDAPRGSPLRPIPGSPTLTRPWASGCAFEPRCHRADAACVGAPPPLAVGDGRAVRCVHPVDDAADRPERGR